MTCLTPVLHIATTGISLSATRAVTSSRRDVMGDTNTSAVSVGSHLRSSFTHRDRDVRIGLKVGQIGAKWDKF